MHLNRDGRKAVTGIFKMHLLQNEHVFYLSLENPVFNLWKRKPLDKNILSSTASGRVTSLFPSPPNTHIFSVFPHKIRPMIILKTPVSPKRFFPQKRGCFCNREVHGHPKLRTEITDFKVSREGTMLDVHTSSHLCAQARIISYSYRPVSGS